MRTIDSATTDAWLSGDYTGERRPMVRATIARLHAITVPFRSQVYCSAVWGQNARPRELPNIKSVKWSRSLDADAATMTMELFNTRQLAIGTLPERNEDLGEPGWFTYNRGKTSWSTSRWGQQANGWHDRLVPDRIIRTYEGYGFDETVKPEDDPHMYLSGVWMIDTVEYTNDGIITVQCRDLGRILIDQIMFVPVVPLKHYPLSFHWYKPKKDTVLTVSGTTKWIRPTYSNSSNTPYVGRNGTEYGHAGHDAFDNSNRTYWLSIGNDNPNADYAFEWIEGKHAKGATSAVKFRTWGGPYRVYVSVFADGKWQGDQTVPYNTSDPVSAPNGANIRYVGHCSARDGELKYYKFPKTYLNATKIRLTFHHLYNSGLGPYPYRAGCRNVEVSFGSEVVETVQSTTTNSLKGNYNDYTDIVKLLLAWGGFYWPHDSARGRIRKTDGTYLVDPAPSNDPYLGKGRVWGDFMMTGTHGVVDLTTEIWDKKPLMDGINYVRDIVGFIFFIDETGGAVWRMPNIWKVGCYIGDGGANAGRTKKVHHLDERTVLIGLTAALSSRNVREKVFVANTSGKIGAVAPGFNPYKTGLRRVGGWTDQRFATKKECQIMADMIAVRQMFTYRTDKVTIAGYPGIQIDDQVRIYERVTNEGYLHYINGVDMEWDLESGRYTYSLDTHWLGDTPFSNWVIDPSKLTAVTRQFLKALGQI